MGSSSSLAGGNNIYARSKTLWEDWLRLDHDLRRRSENTAWADKEVVLYLLQPVHGDATVVHLEFMDGERKVDRYIGSGGELLTFRKGTNFTVLQQHRIACKWL